MGVKIITDSTSYIPKELIEKYDISVISLSIAIENDTFREVDMNNEEFYKKMDKSDTIPISSQPSVDEIYKVFEKHVKENNDIVGIFISSKMSGTFSTACLVKNMILENYPESKIEILDSKSASMQLAFAVITAAKVAYDGNALGEVVQAVQKNQERSRILFAPDTLKYLKKGGRIGGASALIGSLLQIKPILTVVEGKVEVLHKVRAKKRAIQTMLNILFEDVKKYGFGEVTILHINCQETAKKMLDMVKKRFGMKVKICDISPVIGIHVGPGAFGIAYYTKDELKTRV
ncbi:DegV family protein [Clostridium aestuarii]|uniref:DegV family protein n=1 Tax=Clostridium aestuarii TaxID=338193 RepID=A0ABT4D1M1_9CLOT|nr:DegV family protein [Clostridium aestuarii]MCY6485147.1 DegV family protein [Clostridium aestuarii]